MSGRNKDYPLLLAFLQIPSAEARATFLSHLDEPSVEALCNRLRQFVLQEPGYVLPDQKHWKSLEKALKPHKRVIKRLIDPNIGGKEKKIYLKRRQRGGALISIILAAVLPLVASLAFDGIKSAIENKKGKK